MTALSNGQITQVVAQRMILGIAMILGFMPLIGIPFVALGGSGTTLAQASMVLCGFTLLPASLLAFWLRRAALCWFALNASVVSAAAVFGGLVGPGRYDNAFFYLALPLFLFFFFTCAELFHWPAVLAKSNRIYAER